MGDAALFYRGTDIESLCFYTGFTITYAYFRANMVKTTVSIAQTKLALLLPFLQWAKLWRATRKKANGQIKPDRWSNNMQCKGTLMRGLPIKMTYYWCAVAYFLRGRIATRNLQFRGTFLSPLATNNSTYKQPLKKISHQSSGVHLIP